MPVGTEPIPVIIVRDGRYVNARETTVVEGPIRHVRQERIVWLKRDADQFFQRGSGRSFLLGQCALSHTAHEYWALYGLVLVEMGQRELGLSALNRAIQLAPEESSYQTCLEDSLPTESTRQRLLAFCTALLPS